MRSLKTLIKKVLCCFKNHDYFEKIDFQINKFSSHLEEQIDENDCFEKLTFKNSSSTIMWRFCWQCQEGTLLKKFKNLCSNDNLEVSNLAPSLE